MNPYAYAAQVNPVTGHVAVVLNNGIPGSNGGSFVRVYPRQSDKAAEPAAPHSFVMDLATDATGNWYVSYGTGRNQEALHVLTPDGRPLRKLDHRTGYTVLDEGSDSAYLFMDGRVTRLAASTLNATDMYAGPTVSADVAFSPSTRTAYVPEYAGPHVTPVDLAALAPLDLAPAPGKPSSEAYNEGVFTAGDGRARRIFGQFGGTYRTANGTAWERLCPV